MPGIAEEDEIDPAYKWFLNTFSPLHFQSRFLWYGTGGLMDPKNYTLEPYVLSGGGDARFWRWDKARWSSFGKGFVKSQSIAFLGVGIFGAIFDPLGKDEGAGMDEIWGDIYDWEVDKLPQNWVRDLNWTYEVPEPAPGYVDPWTGAQILWGKAKQSKWSDPSNYSLPEGW